MDIRKYYTIVAAILAGISAILVGCSDDDENYAPSPSTDITSNIAPDFAQMLKEKGVVRNAAYITYGDVMNVTSLDVAGNPLTSDGKLTSLQGIEYFSSLEILHCQNNDLGSLDLRYNTELEELRCENNRITSLDLSRCPDLEFLYAGRNNLQQVDIRGLDDLQVADLSHNNLTSVNVDGCADLHTLYINSNRITSVDISRTRGITAFGCDDNPGNGSVLKVRAWFDNSSVPANFTTGSWTYSGSPVTVDYTR